MLKPPKKMKTVKPETITNAKNFLNAVRGKTLNSWELNVYLEENKCRKALHLFARDCNYAQKINGKWFFTDIEYQPIHARKVIERANEYQQNLRKSTKKFTRPTYKSFSFKDDPKINEAGHDSDDERKPNELPNIFGEMNRLKNTIKELNGEVETLRDLIKTYQHLLQLSTTAQEQNEKRLTNKQ